MGKVEIGGREYSFLTLDDLTPVQRVVELTSLSNIDVVKLIDPEKFLAADEVGRALLELQAVDEYQAGLVKSNP
jgi:hypothetical protein